MGEEGVTHFHFFSESSDKVNTVPHDRTRHKTDPSLLPDNISPVGLVRVIPHIGTFLVPPIWYLVLSLIIQPNQPALFSRFPLFSDRSARVILRPATVCPGNSPLHHLLLFVCLVRGTTAGQPDLGPRLPSFLLIPASAFFCPSLLRLGGSLPLDLRRTTTTTTALPHQNPPEEREASEKPNASAPDLPIYRCLTYLGISLPISLFSSDLTVLRTSPTCDNAALGK